VGITERQKITYTYYQTAKLLIDIVINRQQVDHHIHVLARVRNHLRTLCDMNIEVTLVWIPGHCNIYYNDLADLNAKNSIKDAYDISKVSQLTSHTCKQTITKHCNSAWQTRWERSTVARSTYNLIPTVGRRLLFPDDRCCAVSYARLLLDDTLLKVHQQPYTAKLTNVIVTSFGESSNLVSESKMFVKDKAKVSSRVGGVE